MSDLTTEYGSWQNLGDSYALTVEQTVSDALGDYAADYDVVRLTAAYREKINEVLPPGVSLCGNDFIGPYGGTVDGVDSPHAEKLDIPTLVGEVDLWELVREFERGPGHGHALQYVPVSPSNAVLLDEIATRDVAPSVAVTHLRSLGLVTPGEVRLTSAGECTREVMLLTRDRLPSVSLAGAAVLAFGVEAVPGANRTRVLHRLAIAGLWSVQLYAPTDLGAEVGRVLWRYRRRD